jgi:hypothetical protein
MKAVDPGMEGLELVVYAKDQPEYFPLPARVDSNGMVVTCWELTWRERVKMLICGRFYLSVLTFGQRLQPIRLTVEKPEVE